MRAMLSVRFTRACSQSLQRRKLWNGDAPSLQISGVVARKLPLLPTRSQ